MRKKILATRLLSLLTASLGTFLLGTADADAQQSSNIIAAVAASAKVNKSLTLGAQLADAWDGAAVPGRVVYVQIGDRYSLATT